VRGYQVQFQVPLLRRGAGRVELGLQVGVELRCAGGFAGGRVAGYYY